MSVIGILGTVHDEKMREESNYSLEKIGGLIEAFNPDIICGEVRPEDWEKYCDNNEYEGYLGPNEYRRLIIPLCEKKGIKFVPVDWFENDLMNQDCFKGKSDSEIKILEKEIETLIENFWKVAKESEVPFNSLDFNNIVEKKHEFLQRVNPKVENLYWVCRNEIMVERIKHALEGNEGKRVLCTVGAEHNYYYCKGLEESNWEVIYPLK